MNGMNRWMNECSNVGTVNRHSEWGMKECKCEWQEKSTETKTNVNEWVNATVNRINEGQEGMRYNEGNEKWRE